MGIIAWIVLGLGAGLLANMLIPGRRSQGLIITCVIGIAGALLGGWLATKLFHVVTLHGFFNLSTWLTAIAGAAILLLAYHLVTSRTTSRSRRSGRGRSRRWVHLLSQRRRDRACRRPRVTPLSSSPSSRSSRRKGDASCPSQPVLPSSSSGRSSRSP